MAKRLLPDKDSPEGQAILEQVKAGKADALWKALGYKNRTNFLGAIRKSYGFFVSREPIEWHSVEEEPPAVRDLSPVKLREYKGIKIGKGDPETQVLIIGDGHAGEITPSFNPDVYKKRMNKLFDNTMVITNLHRNMYPLNDLIVIDVGDNVHGESPYQGATIASVSCGAVDQVYDIALPAIRNLLYSFKQEFKTVRFIGVRGNHGRVSPISPRTSNWDMMLYKTLAKMQLPKGITIEYSDDFKALVNIEGFTFFVFHGDQCRATMGVPYFALTKKLMSWSNTFSFHYAICGHYHKEDYLRVSSKIKLLMNGSLVTDDPYALEVVGTSSIPCQWSFGVHKNYGISWLYNLILDRSFLPGKGKRDD